MSLLELKPCKRCGKTFLGSVKGKFCSKACRVRFHNRLNAIKRMMRDAEFKQRSLARLFAWKERKKQEKEALGQTRKQHVVYADIDWI
ncbi:hypothetical protein B0813_002955 [Candidatus Fervidibacteria bacterium JGI MDM2 SSWTFF-3-K9]